MIRRYWFPLLLSIAIVALIGRVPSATDSLGNTVPIASLRFPLAYVATSPVSRVLDALTLLSVPQTIATLVVALLLLLIAFGFRPSRIIAIVVVIGLLEAAVALLPRPMARLVVNDPDLVVVDFHSHTGASHDVRKSYDADDNRAWHDAGGFNAAWITDHVKFDGAVAGRARNPQKAGDGFSTLTGVEGRYHRIMSTVMLALDERDTALLNKRGNLLPGATASGRTPYTMIALPNRNLDSVTTASLDSLPHFAAIELIDAAPRGLGQFDKEETRIRNLARDRHLTLVAASNNHGFGRAVAAWNLVALPGWKSLTPDSLAIGIENSLRQSQPTIVMRTRPRTHDASLPLTLPLIAYQTLGSLTIPERISWLLWIWLPVVLARRSPLAARRSPRSLELYPASPSLAPRRL